MLTTAAVKMAFRMLTKTVAILTYFATVSSDLSIFSSTVALARRLRLA